MALHFLKALISNLLQNRGYASSKRRRTHRRGVTLVGVATPGKSTIKDENSAYFRPAHWFAPVRALKAVSKVRQDDE
jgi:hypothetical protein